MNLTSMRAMFRRIMLDEGSEDWSDSEALELLNGGIQDVQEEVMAVDRDAFVQWDKADVVADQRFYPRPTSCYYEIELAYSADPATTAYKRMDYKSYDEIREGEVKTARGSGVLIEDIITYADTYAVAGKNYYLGWTPEAGITDGLQTAYVPMISVAVGADVPDLPLYLHRAAVISACMAATLETPEDDTKLTRARKLIIDKIPLYYTKTLSDQPYLRVEGIREGDGMG